ncbi:alpha/beta fold hydrolase [Streptomyces muensis]|uniref:Alpha/beta hydrolase n=1 Tax=Streptomyces muensis TaxID=1077944 RepID=A0A9X1TV13_STRM4|nr:alpha/beta fold hydrolase [Streptomyces muensis]MCF1596968.1 alpha/beta hydrolase [Streptomyces muensis]
MASVGGPGRLGVVFVHGFNSSAAMWEPFTSLIDRDAELDFVRPLPFSYDTRLWQAGPLRRVPDFDTVADSLKEFLDTETEGFDRLMLVCHSQGGLIGQRCLARMLAEGRGKDLTRMRRVVLFACPNNGSQFALGLRRGLLRRNPQERQLRPLDQQITDTQRTILRDIVNAREVTSRACPIPFSVYAGETDNIVTPASARSVFPDAAVLPGDHSGIVRPTSREHRSFSTLRRLMLTTAGAEPVTTDSSTSEPPTLEPSTTGVPEFSGPFPDTVAVVRVAERIPDMDDADFRRQVIALMRQALAPQAGFTPAFRAHPRDHLLEIVERCQSHRMRAAALAAFRDAVGVLRPDDAATVELRAMIRDPE